MFILKENYEKIYTIKKSKFIVKLHNISNKIEIINILKNIKNEHKTATHYCYAYILKNEKKFSDDGEPSRTAGIPILNILEKKNLGNILCVVIRYFGGIKLGAGGLIRAYSSVVKEAIIPSNITEYMEFIVFSVEFEYNDKKIIESIIKKDFIVNKIFDKNITYIIKSTTSEFNVFKKQLDAFKLKVLDTNKI